MKINTPKKDESSSSKVAAKKKANTGGSVPFFQLWQYATRAQISLAMYVLDCLVQVLILTVTELPRYSALAPVFCAL